ncbi:putative transposase-like protein [Klebsiella pneumoniae subsp. rhinoscleromatis]|nr:putative transposase-like protein [Klebsiella pneumoniae subsp. rhinoscleromatis]
MKKTRYTEEQIAFALKQAETGTRVEEVCRKMAFLKPHFTSMDYLRFASTESDFGLLLTGFAPIFPDTCYHLTHYWPAAVDIPVASDNPVHYADAIRYNARTPLQGSLLPLTRLV